MFVSVAAALCHNHMWPDMASWWFTWVEGGIAGGDCCTNIKDLLISTWSIFQETFTLHRWEGGQEAKESGRAHLHIFFVPFICTTVCDIALMPLYDVSLITWVFFSPLFAITSQSTAHLTFCLICCPNFGQWIYLRISLRLSLQLTSFKIRTGLRGLAYYTWLGICFCCSITANIS